MAAACGPKAPSTTVRRSAFPYRQKGQPLEQEMNNLLKPILLVEDSPKDVELTLAALEEIQIANRVIVRRDGTEALAYLHGTLENGEPSGVPVVVLLDIKMPKVSGIDMLRLLKGDPRLNQIPVVMLTSSREGPDVEKCYKLGANAYVVKPVDFESFFHAVKEVGRFWAVVNQPPDPFTILGAAGESAQNNPEK
jgi:CheY-like chemotaxis protein